MIYTVGNSVSWRNPPTYSDMLGAKNISTPVRGVYTVLHALLDTKNLHLKKNDWLIFNIGVNDSILRKNKDLQCRIIRAMIKSMDDDSTRVFLEGRLRAFENKGESELLPLLTLREFDQRTDELFSRFPRQGIVMGVNHVAPGEKHIGWAIPQLVQTNAILRKNAGKYRMQFINLWYPHVHTTDGVHFTRDGHKHVADIVRGVVNPTAEPVRKDMKKHSEYGIPKRV